MKKLAVLALVGMSACIPNAAGRVKNAADVAKHTVDLEACFDKAQKRYIDGDSVIEIDKEYKACADAADAKAGKK